MQTSRPARIDRVEHGCTDDVRGRGDINSMVIPQQRLNGVRKPSDVDVEQQVLAELVDLFLTLRPRIRGSSCHPEL